MEQDAKLERGREADDEISLIDLAIVLIRRRAIILWSLVLSAVIAFGYFYAAPALGLRDIKTVFVEAKYISVPVPASIRGEIGLDVAQYATALIKSPVYIADLAWELGVEGAGGMAGPDDAEFVGLVKQGFIGGTYKVSVDSGSIQVSLKATNQAKAEAFMRSLATRVDADLRKEVARRARLLSTSMEPLLARVESANAGLSDSIKQAMISSNAYSIGELPLFTQVGDLQVITEKKSGAKGAIVVTFAGFFLGLLAAFVAEAIANIRKDEEAMRRIREALGKGSKG